MVEYFYIITSKKTLLSWQRFFMEKVKKDERRICINFNRTGIASNGKP